MTLMIQFWVIRSLMRCVNIFRGQNPHCRCLCTRGRQVRPFCWILRDCVGSGVLRTAGGGALNLCPSFSDGGGGGRGGGGVGDQVIRDRTAGLSVPILRVWRLPFFRRQPGIWICSFITLDFWSWWELRSRPDCLTVHQRSGWIYWARNKPWQRPLTCNGMQVLCYQICRYCHNLLWQ